MNLKNSKTMEEESLSLNVEDEGALDLHKGSLL